MLSILSTFDHYFLLPELTKTHSISAMRSPVSSFSKADTCGYCGKEYSRFTLATATATATALLAQLACLGPVRLVVLKELIVDGKVLGAPDELDAEAFEAKSHLTPPVRELRAKQDYIPVVV